MDKEKETSIIKINESIEKLYFSLVEKPLRVLGIFNDFFGEERVDMQDCCSLDEFKSWMNETPIASYVDRIIIGFGVDDWKVFQTFTITDLPVDKVESVINSFQLEKVRCIIGNALFHKIIILVHFPHVRVTNEHDRFVDINHLWAKVKVMYNGTMCGGFTLNRSEYTMLHMMSNYMHSHVSCIPTSNFTNFMSPCTGSGPINDTISSLNRDCDEDIWNLFCLELSKYVTVESIAGRPYKYLEKIGSNTMTMGVSRYITCMCKSSYSNVISNDKIKEFTRYFLESRKLKFNYVNGSYSIGMPYIEFIVAISNSFIEWYNNEYNESKVKTNFATLIKRGIIRECIIDNGKIYYEDGVHNINNFISYIGKKVCTFKGKEITINIVDINEVRNDNKSIILDPHLSLYILTNILKVLNYRYGRNKASKEYTIGTEVRYL